MLIGDRRVLGVGGMKMAADTANPQAKDYHQPVRRVEQADYDGLSCFQLSSGWFGPRRRTDPFDSRDKFFHPIVTNVPGMSFDELFPKTA